MRKSYLEVTYRKGRCVAAYVQLPRKASDRSVRTEKRAGGLVVDYASDGRPIGIEITSLSRPSLAAINQIISLVDEPASLIELSPVGAVA